MTLRIKLISRQLGRLPKTVNVKLDFGDRNPIKEKYFRQIQNMDWD
jgi:hypothetical protein